MTRVSPPAQLLLLSCIGVWCGRAWLQPLSRPAKGPFRSQHFVKAELRHSTPIDPERNLEHAPQDGAQFVVWWRFCQHGKAPGSSGKQELRTPVCAASPWLQHERQLAPLLRRMAPTRHRMLKPDARPSEQLRSCLPVPSPVPVPACLFHVRTGGPYFEPIVFQHRQQYGELAVSTASCLQVPAPP